MNIARVRALMSKEWRETVRDRMFLLLAFLLPILWMLVFGYGLVLDVENVTFAALDRDRSDLSRDYLYRFIESRYFSFEGYLPGDQAVAPALQSTSVRAVIVVPEQFQERLIAGEPVSVQTLLDGTFPLHTDITKGYVIAINNAFNEALLSAHLSRTRGIGEADAEALIRPITLEVRYLFNEEIRSAWSMVPALLMLTLMISSPLLTALGVVREKESGSIYNIYSSTVSRLEFLVGKLSPYVLISTINVVVLWVMAVTLFDVPFKGSIGFFFGASILFILCSTGIGLLISLLVRTQMAALIITIVIATVPTILFSGMLVPVSSLGRGAQVQAHIIPGTYYTTILRGSFLKGVGMDILWTDVVALGVYAVVLTGIALQLFVKRPRA